MKYQFPLEKQRGHRQSGLNGGGCKSAANSDLSLRRAGAMFLFNMLKLTFKWRRGARAALTTVVLWYPGASFADPVDCQIECEKESALCLNIPSLVAGKDIPWAFHHLNRYLRAKFPNTIIVPNMLLGFFGMTPAEDPCNRGETIVEGGLVRNSGKDACRISVSVPVLAGANNLTIGFDVPTELRGNISKDGDTFKIDFSNVPLISTPQFWIGNDLLNGDWGGKIIWIMFGPSRSIVSTENGCLSYAY
jgi:hypothetical protein